MAAVVKIVVVVCKWQKIWQYNGSLKYCYEATQNLTIFFEHSLESFAFIFIFSSENIETLRNGTIIYKDYWIIIVCLFDDVRL